MYRVIYASRAAVPLRDRELEELLVDARIRNEEDDLTGLLCYFGPDVTDEPGFLQVLEGDQDAVEAAYARISRDRRHRGLRRISAKTATERMFPDWRMGLEYVTHEDLARAVPGLSGTGRLVVMAELVSDPVRAEQILVGATY